MSKTFQKPHIYDCNSRSPYSSQRYPTRILATKHIPFESKKLPNGWLQLSVDSVDGYFTSLLKCYVNAKGQRYCVFGGHRLYEGYRGPVALSGVPYSLEKTITDCGGLIAAEITKKENFL